MLVPSHSGGSVNIVSTCHITVQPHPSSMQILGLTFDLHQDGKAKYLKGMVAMELFSGWGQLAVPGGPASSCQGVWQS